MRSKVLKIPLVLLVILGFYFSFQIEKPSIVLANSSEWEIQHFRLFTNKRLAIVFKNIKTGKIYNPIINADMGTRKWQFVYLLSVLNSNNKKGTREEYLFL